VSRKRGGMPLSGWRGRGSNGATPAKGKCFYVEGKKGGNELLCVKGGGGGHVKLADGPPGTGLSVGGGKGGVPHSIIGGEREAGCYLRCTTKGKSRGA